MLFKTKLDWSGYF